jgi:hypothetical protein
MEKLAHVLADKHAQLWINHDKPSSDAQACAGVLRLDTIVITGLDPVIHPLRRSLREG